jgi:hypothetical protein
MNYGFKPPVIDNEHYVLGQGNVPFQVLQKNGDWTDSLPVIEKQATPFFDTYNCTGFGATNQIEMYMFKRYGSTVNYSDRWVGIIAGTDPKTGGNDPQTVYEAIRKYGLIPEEMLPFNDSITSAEDFFSFKGADREACYRAGREWLSKYDFKHEWVFRPDSSLTDEEKYHNMKVALKYSPLGVAVYAWQPDGRGVYIDFSSPNHWTSEYSFTDFQKYFDSYEPYTKIGEQKVIYCKRINIELRKTVASTTDIGSIILKWLKKLFRIK